LRFRIILYLPRSHSHTNTLSGARRIIYADCNVIILSQSYIIINELNLYHRAPLYQRVTTRSSCSNILPVTSLEKHKVLVPTLCFSGVSIRGITGMRSPFLIFQLIFITFLSRIHIFGATSKWYIYIYAYTEAKKCNPRVYCTQCR